MNGRSAQLIRQTLDGVVTPSVRDAILASALHVSALGKIPDEPDALYHFLQGALRGELIRGLGPELAASILDEIRRATQFDDELAPATSRSPRRLSRPPRSLSPPPRRNTPSHRPSSSRGTPPTPPSSSRSVPRAPTPPPYSGPISRRGAPWGSDEYPSGDILGFGEPATLDPRLRGPAYVLVISADDSLIDQLQPWLQGRAELAQVSSIRELLRDLDVMGESRIAVVVDCRRPSIQPTAIAALADELPPNVNVVLLCPNADQHRRLRTVSEAVSRFIVVRGDVRPREIAHRCATLVG